MKLSISFIGVDKLTNKRIWGYTTHFRDDFGWLSTYIFWGPSVSNIRIIKSVVDQKFYLNVKRKKRNYNSISSSIEEISVLGQISEILLIRKLTNG